MRARTPVRVQAGFLAKEAGLVAREQPVLSHEHRSPIACRSSDDVGVQGVTAHHDFLRCCVGQRRFDNVVYIGKRLAEKLHGLDTLIHQQVPVVTGFDCNAFTSGA